MLCVCVCLNKERGVVQSFLGIKDVKHAHAAGVLSAVQSDKPIRKGYLVK